MTLARPLKARLRSAVFLGVLTSLPISGAIVGIHWASVYGPRWWEIPGVEFLTIPMFLALLALPVSLVATLLKRARHASLAATCFIFVFFLLQALSWVAAWRIRDHGFAQLARQARPLVQAIHDYEDLNGSPPESLDELPADLRRDLPTFDYLADADTPLHYHGNPWILSLPTATGILNWDQFIYYPLQNYPDLGHGGWLKRIEDWAYVHE